MLKVAAEATADVASSEVAAIPATLNFFMKNPFHS
jgi:hypothetical protein